MVQARLVADPCGRRAAGVQRQQHPPVPLRSVHAYLERLSTGGGAPIDGANVVAADVLAETVELGAPARPARRDLPLDLSQAGELLRQERPRPEVRQDPNLSGHAYRPLPSGQAERSN